MPAPDSIEIIRPDDWHVHLRDGAAIARLAADTAARFGRAIVMPNLDPPVRTVDEALAYRDRILRALPADTAFEPLMTLYLNDEMTAGEIARARRSGAVHAVKLYPAGATTNSAAGVTDLARVDAVLAAMQEHAMPLLVHGEVVDPEVDFFDRERVFVESVLAPALERFPSLKTVLEHVTTREAVDFVRAAPSNVAATITAHHLLMNRNALFAGGLRPHHYCLPILKREHHREALVAAATGGEPSFFLGTDSAPHPRDAKEAACGCAGLYTAHAGIELYAEAFDAAGALERLEGFASVHGPRFYGLPVNTGRITLTRRAWQVPDTLDMGVPLVPFRAGAAVAWSLSP